MDYPKEPNQADNGASQTALEKGYTNTMPNQRNTVRHEDSDGSTYEGNPYDRGGFAGRPQGWER